MERGELYPQMCPGGGRAGAIAAVPGAGLVQSVPQTFSSPIWFPYLASTASSVPTQRGQGRAQGLNKAQSRPWSYGSRLAESPAGVTYWVPGSRTSETGLPAGAAHPGETGRLWGPFGGCSDSDWDAWEGERKIDRSCRKGGDV